MLLRILKREIRKKKSTYFFIREMVMRYRIRYKGWRGVSVKSWVMPDQKYIAKDFLLGDFSFVGAGCTIYPKVTAGRFLLMAPEVAIIGADHEYNKVGMPICFSGRRLLRPTVIGDDVWIGMRAHIMVGVKIGSGSIIGANTVVTNDVPEFAIVVGTPGKVVGWRFESESERVKHLELISNIHTYQNIIEPLE